MIVLGLILFVGAGWGFAWCLCRTAGCDEPACGEQLSHVRLIVGGGLDALARTVRLAPVIDQSHGELFISYEYRAAEDKWVWEVEVMANDARLNCSAYAADLGGALARVGARLHGGQA